jgi:hypothetical protein
VELNIHSAMTAMRTAPICSIEPGTVTNQTPTVTARDSIHPASVPGQLHR